MKAEKLLARGFDTAQVNQLLKINEYGLDLSCIDVYTPIKTLRKIRDNLKDNKLSERVLSYAKDLILNDHNPVEMLIDMENASERFAHVCYCLLDNNYDIHNLKKLDIYAFYEVADAAMSGSGVSVKCLEDPNLSIKLVRKAVNAAKNEIDIEKYFNKGLSEDRIYQILDLRLYDKTLDVSVLLDTSFDDRQAQVIANAIRHKTDLLAYCDNKFSAEQMEVILDGLYNHVDVTIFNKRRYNPAQMEAISNALSHNMFCRQYEIADSNVDVNKLLNPDYSSAFMNLLFMCMKDRVDTSQIENKGYDFTQAFAIIQGLSEGIDASIYSDKEISGEEMRLILNAIRLKNDVYHDYDKHIDMSFMLDKTVSTRSKLMHLIDAISISFKDVDLNEDRETSLDDIIMDKSTDLNDYYLDKFDIVAMEEIWYGDEVVVAKTSDGYTLKVTYEDLDFPDIILKTSDETEMCEELVNTYEEEIKRLAQIISFVGFSEEDGYFIKNLATNDIREYIKEEDQGSCLDEFFKFYNRMSNKTIDSVRFNRMNAFSLFDDFEGMEESCGPDITKIMLSYDLKSPLITAYIFDKQLRDAYGDKSSEELYDIFKKEVESAYASYMDDTYRATLYDKEGNVIRVEDIYGSRNMKENLEKLFDTRFTEYKEFAEIEEDIER